MGCTAELKNVTKSFGKIVALDGVSLKVGKGEILGLVGPNGAGKSTTVRLLLGLVGPTSGRVSVFGLDPAASGVQSPLARIGVVLESPGLYVDLTVEENIMFSAKLYGVKNWEGSMKSALEFMGLWERRRDPPRILSKGMKQKVALARALVVDPDFLILDEPTSGIDPVFQSDLRQKVLDLAHLGKTVFLCSHNMAEVEELCSRIAVIDQGHIVAEGTIPQIVGSYADRCFRVIIDPDKVERAVVENMLRMMGSVKKTVAQNELRIVLGAEYSRRDLLRRTESFGNGSLAVHPERAGVAEVVDSILSREALQ